MKSPGIVKILQGLLFISIIINAFLVIQILELNQQKHKEKTQTHKSNKAEKPISTQDTITIDKEKINNFIKEYLDNFFKTDDAALTYISKHTEPKLFEETLKAEIEKRKNQNLNSIFLINDSYIEKSNNNYIKALIIGQEQFANQSYKARNINVELIIDYKTLEVKSIPLFEVQE